MRVSVSLLLLVLIASAVCLSSSLKLDARRKVPAHHRRSAASVNTKAHKKVSSGAAKKVHHHHVAGKKLRNLEKDVTVEELEAHVEAGLNDVKLIKNALVDADEDLHKALEEIADLRAEKVVSTATAATEKATKPLPVTSKEDVVAAEEDDDDDEEDVESEETAKKEEDATSKDDKKEGDSDVAKSEAQDKTDTAEANKDGDAKTDEAKKDESDGQEETASNDADNADAVNSDAADENEAEDQPEAVTTSVAESKDAESKDAETTTTTANDEADKESSASDEDSTTAADQEASTSADADKDSTVSEQDKANDEKANDEAAKDAEEDLDDEDDAVMDLESVALLQQGSNDVSFDDMNDYATADDDMVGVGTRRAARPVHLAGQENSPKVEDGGDPRDQKYGFGVNAEGGTSDIYPTANGMDLHPQQAVIDETADKGVNPTEKVVTLEDGMTDVGELPPGTGGGAKTPVAGGQPPKGPSKDNQGADDSVCMCKRQGAPRKMKGFDRVKCKKHPKPTPTPEPPVEGIRQCVTGTWPGKKGDTMDANSTDTICIYFPARLPTPPEVAPEREFPDECYDDRNEFVAEGIEKRPYDEFLIQTGAFAACDC